MSENEQVKATRLSLLANPANRVINPIEEVKRLSVSNTTALNTYINPNNVTYQLGKLGVDSQNNPPLPTLSNFVSNKSPVSELDVSGWNGSGNYTDNQGVVWAPTSVTYETVDGYQAFGMNGGSRYFETSTNTTFGQYYTQYYLWWPRVSNSGWRTLFRGNNDHAVIINNNATDLGMYSNRNGAFRDTGYNITVGTWQTLIVTGVGDTSTSSTGTQTYYVNGTNVGTTDRVICGTTQYRLGWPDNQGPGYFIAAGILNTQLTTSEIADLDAILKLKAGLSSGGFIGFTDTSNLPPEVEYITDSAYDLPVNFTKVQRFKSEGLASNNPINEGKLRLQVNSGTSQYNGDTDDDFRREITKSRAIVSDVSSGGGGGGGSSGPVQSWY